MDAERIGGFTRSGTYCVWCSHYYPESYFRQTIDVCKPCYDFRMRHYHDLGNFFVRTVDEAEFRVYVPYKPKMSESQIDDQLRSLI